MWSLQLNAIEINIKGYITDVSSSSLFGELFMRAANELDLAIPELAYFSGDLAFRMLCNKSATILV